MNDLGLRRRAWEQCELAHKAQMAGEVEQAVRLYRESLDCYPTAEAYTFLGWTHCFRGDLDEAMAACLQAIEVDPDFGNPYNDIGAYLIELRRLDEAIPWLERATQAKRYDSYCFPWMNLGRVYERKRLWPRALECYKKALGCDDTYAPAAKALSRIRGLLN